MADAPDQNRSEAATPFKLRRAREKGMVARGLDLSFVATLLGAMGFAAVAGATLIATLRETMVRLLGAGVAGASDARAAAALAGRSAAALLHPVALLGATLVALVLLVEIVQLRGLLFSAAPLKPDFTRLNPATGLKRLTSPRMLKEAIKSVAKMAAYALVGSLAIRAALAGAEARIGDAPALARALWSSGDRLLLLFAGVAAAAAIVDQALSRTAFASQMRMSRRELIREVKEREGDARIKGKRKQLHASFAQQAKGLGRLPGADMLVVNPLHVAVALAYRPGADPAPVVIAKGAERQAALLRRAAARHSVPIIESAALARALFKECAIDAPIVPAHYGVVADLYHRLNASRHA